MQQQPERILRRPEVTQTTGLKPTAIYEGMKRGTFPAAIPLGANSVGWLSSDIQKWIEERVKAAQPGAKAERYEALHKARREAAAQRRRAAK